MDIEANLNAYLKTRGPTERYTSFDYCFNHFQQHRERNGLADLVAGANMQISCLHLGFYLASWGMLRGSAALLRRSARHYMPVIQVIASSGPAIWDLDADCYDDAGWDVVSQTAAQIAGALPDGASDTLITKIMLGVYGCVPAFDEYFKRGFGVSTFGRKSFMRVGAFYRDNQGLIERHRVHTLDFNTGTETARTYTRAKVIDMIFFVAGGAKETP